MKAHVLKYSWSDPQSAFFENKKTRLQSKDQLDELSK